MERCARERRLPPTDLREARSRGYAPQGFSAGRFNRRRVLVAPAATGAQTPDATPLLRRASV